MPKPFLEGRHLAGEISDTDCTVTNQPRDEHDRYAGTQTEHDRHDPVPSPGQRERDIDHRQEIHEPMRTKCDREENTEDKRPKPTLLTIRLFEPFTDAVIVLMVMMSAEQQHDTADEHKTCQNGFAVMS